MLTKEQLMKINEFTRRDFEEEEVYAFDVILCDNEVDRDNERFSIDALKQLEKLFVGKTGIFDHEAKSVGQTARIFETALLTDESKNTSAGEPYMYLKASAYMVRTDENESLIKEIDGGIKKEVSISCSAGSRICSVCRCDLNKRKCPHIPGNLYGAKTAHIILGDITDAYEWSFVAVPAQPNAGVTKKYYAEREKEETDEILKKLMDNLKGDIYRLCIACGSPVLTKAAKSAADRMDVEELMEFKNSLEKEYRLKDYSQLDIKEESVNEFKLEGGKE